MTPVLIGVIAAVAITLTVVSARRALAERDAVDRQRRTLDLLGTLADRADGADQIAPRTPREREARPGQPPAYQPRHRATRRRRRPPLAMLAVLAGLAFVLAGGLYLRSRTNHPSAATGPAPKAAPPAAPLRTEPQSVPPTDTTVAARPVVLVASDTQQARFSVQRSSVNLELVLTGPCWVEIRSSLGTGPVIFAGTLKAGTRRPLPTTAANRGIRVRLGNPAGVAVSVDGSILAVPRPSGTQPFTLFFQPPT